MKVLAWTSAVVGMGALATALSASSSPADNAAANKAIHELIAKECMSCHGADGIGRIRLDTSSRIVQHQKLITRQILSGAMPPHSYESEVDLFGLARQLTDEDRLLVQQWRTASEIPFTPPVSAGSSLPLSTMKIAPDHPIPDLGSNVFRAREVKMDGDFSGLRIMPDAPTSLRTSTVAVVAQSDVRAALDAGAQSGTLGGVAPLFLARVGQGSPNPGAFSVPKGASVVIVNHFKATGKVESDGFRIEFERGPVFRPVSYAHLAHAPFEIPAKKSIELTIRHQFAEDAELQSIVPEAKYFCEEIEVALTASDGAEKKLYHTRRWDFSFAPGIKFAKPVPVRKGDVIRARFLYRNDDRCRMNEGRKPALVKSGTGPEDEACGLGLVYSVSR